MNKEIKPRAIYPISAYPTHIGHLSYALQIINSGIVRGLDLVVTNVHPEKPMQVSFEHRLQMTRLSVFEFFGDDSRLVVNPIEARLPTPNYTGTTFLETESEYGRIIPVIGSDNLPEVYYWKGMWEVLLRTGAIILPRDGVKIFPSTVRDNMVIMPMNSTARVSSRDAREIKELHAFAGFTGILAARYAKEHQLYGFA